jgi:hypothetical protein
MWIILSEDRYKCEFRFSSIVYSGREWEFEKAHNKGEDKKYTKEVFL